MADPWAKFEPVGQSDPWQGFEPVDVQAAPVPQQPMQAQAAPVPQMAPQKENPFSAVLKGMQDTELAASQGTMPYVRNRQGNFWRQPLGVVEEYDFGQAYKDADGQLKVINPKTDVVLRDPETGQMVAFARDAEFDEGRVASFARLALPGMVTNPIAGPARQAATAAGRTTASALAADRAAGAAEDLAAFNRLGVREFGPAFSQGPAASVAKQLSETPIIGAPIKNALDESIAGAAQAAENIASRYGGATTFDEMGSTVQRGLERFRTQGFDDLQPGSVRAMGINPESPVPAPQIMSQGALREAQQAAPIRQQIGANQTQTTRGTPVGTGRPIDQTLTNRTRIEDLSDDELLRVVRSPARDTSFSSRAEALYERSWRMIPGMMRENNTANPNMIAARNTSQVVGGIQNMRERLNLTGQSAVSGQLWERLQNTRAANFPLADLRMIRTEVGRALSGTSPLQQTLNRSELNALYAAVSRDIEIGLETLANRAAIRTQLGGNRADRVSVETARAAAGALKAFRTADRYFRQGMARMEEFYGVLQANTPETAARRLVSAAMDGGKGNISLLRSAHAALRPDEWGDVAALVIRNMGTPNASARGTAQEVGFSVETFLTNWQKMDERARNLILGHPEHTQALNDLVRVANRLANVEAMRNTSRSASNAVNIGGILSAGASLYTGTIGPLLGAALAGGGTSLLMSRPAYARWLARYAGIRAQSVQAPAQAQAAMTAHIARLQQMAANDNQLLPLVAKIAAENGIGERLPGQNQGNGGPREQQGR